MVLERLVVTEVARTKIVARRLKAKKARGKRNQIQLDPKRQCRVVRKRGRAILGNKLNGDSQPPERNQEVLAELSGGRGKRWGFAPPLPNTNN